MQDCDVFIGNISLSGYTNNGKIEKLKNNWHNKLQLNGYLELDGIGLTTLEGGCPEIINGYFTCSGNALLNLIGGPNIVTDVYMAGGNPLTSLKGAPIKCHEFYIDNCRLITSLEGIGKNYIKDCHRLAINNCPITSNLLGIFLIKNLDSVFFNYENTHYNWYEFPEELVNIINTGISNKSDILDIQEELITKGFRTYAKL